MNAGKVALLRFVCAAMTLLVPATSYRNSACGTRRMWLPRDRAGHYLRSALLKFKRLTVLFAVIAFGFSQAVLAQPTNNANALLAWTMPLLLSPHQLESAGVTVSASPAPVAPGNPVTLRAVVTGNAPTGTVQFRVNGVNIGTPVSLVNGVATLTTTLTTLGTDAITAVYSGDSNNAMNNAAAAVIETVTPSVPVPALPAWGIVLLSCLLMLVGTWPGALSIFSKGWKREKDSSKW